MNKFISTVKRYIPTKRKLIQLYFALLYNINLKGFATGKLYKGESKRFCVPGINCYSCPGAVGACPLGSMQGAYGNEKSTMFYMGGIILLFCIMFGRMICGYACPFGLIQELFYKVKTPKVKKGPLTRILSYLKYFILVFLAVIVPVMYALKDQAVPGFCKYICPAGTLEGGISLLANKVNNSYFSSLGPLFTWKFALLVSFIVGSVFIFRIFCRFVCPLGALYGLFNRFSVFGIKLEESKCVHCNLCISNCKLDIKKVGDHECISCGECINVCPTKAISWKGSVFKLHPNQVQNTKEPEPVTDKKRRIVQIISAVVMLAVLIGAFFYYWNDVPETKAPVVIEKQEEDLPPYGVEVGNTCMPFELELFDTAGLTGEKLDPTKSEKVTVINFWGTWCGPCVAELPHFNGLAKEYGDDITVVAIHSDNGFAAAPSFVAKNYGDSPMVFAKDVAGEVYHTDYLMCGDAYPVTFVLDSRGVITSKFVSSVTEDELRAAIDDALANS
ncbi:MAG: 4Fe-4S binding protein [Ruminococcaceae bacterium]|nr:4Fe-4S binding protein [Oscillospiraceae bacterium]